MSQGKLLPVMLLWGDDRGALTEAVGTVRKAALRAAGDDQGMGAFNHERFDGPYTREIKAVLAACAQVPVMAERRLVELSDPELFGKHVGDSDSDNATSATEALVDYVASPCPTTILLISSGGLRKTSKLVKAVDGSSGARQVRFETPKKDEDAVARLGDVARTRGIELDPRAAARLVELVGTSSDLLVAGLERARAFSGEDRVALEHVDAVTSLSRASVFELTDAVGQGDAAEALRALAKLFGSEKDVGAAHQTFGLLVRQIRQIYGAKLAGRHAGAVLGLPPFLAKKVSAQARAFDEARLRKAYAGLARIDKQLKGAARGRRLASQAPLLVMQRWVLETCDALPGIDR